MRPGGVLSMLRAAVASAIVVAIGFEFQHSVDSGFETVNFFSFFTILSNVFAAALLVYEVARPPETHGATAAAIRGAVTLYMSVTLIVYSVLLGPSDIGGPEPWVNVIVHFVAPTALIVDWVFNPPEQIPGRSVILAWLAWPVVWVGYTSIRGVAQDWYPYPFLDPDESGGYAGVFAYMLAIVAAFAAVGLALHWWARRVAR